MSRGTQRHKLADGSQFRIGMGRRRRGVDPELHSAEKLGLNTNLLFTNAAQTINQIATQFVLRFLRRPPATKSIAAFGYAEGEDSSGFMYVASS